MISKKAIQRFLSDERADFRWMKRLTHRELDELLDDLDPKPRFWPKLGKHQKVGLYLGIKHGCWAFWFDMGTGKTLLSLELLQYWWDCKLLRRAVIFVISDKAFDTWERQIRQYRISIPYCVLDAGASETKWKTLANFEDGIILVAYPGAVAMVSGRSKSKKKKMALNPKLVDRFIDDVDAVIFDESTKAANHKSLTHKLARKVSYAAEFRYALAGMPFGRDPTPLWAQMFLIDHGKTLGPTLALFRAGFFNEEENPWTDRPNSYLYKFKQSLSGKLNRIVQNRSLTYTSDECIDLPPERKLPEFVILPKDTMSYYKELVAQVINAGKNKRVIKNAFLRMRQLSSGFIGLKDDEDGSTVELEFSPNVKLERLLDLADTFPRNRKALIFYQFTHSGRAIAKAFKDEFELNIPWLWSGTKNPRRDIQSFIDRDAEEMPFILVQNQIGAFSLDGLQVANYEFFYESPISPVDREQAQRRIKRQGQQHRTVFYVDLIVRNTVDEKILQFHQEGRDLFQSLLVDAKRVLG